MPIANLHVLHGINTGSGFIGQISNGRPSPKITDLVGTPTGLPSPTFVSVMGLKPEVSFDSTQVATLLALLGSGLMVDLSGGNTDLYFKKAVYLGTRVADATAAHTRLRMSNGGLILNSLSAGDRSEAKANCLLVASYDGTNDPIVPAGSVALAGSEASAEHFVAGPAWLNGTQFSGVQDLRVDFGLKLIRVSGDGDIFDTFVGVEVGMPVITIRGINVPWTTFGLKGVALTSGSWYLRAKADGGNNVANATAAHINFGATAGLIEIEDSQGGDNEPVITTVRCPLVSASASVLPLAITTGVAITD